LSIERPGLEYRTIAFLLHRSSKIGIPGAGQQEQEEGDSCGEMKKRKNTLKR